ncbi:MAG TPA: FliA/WhiG family RNA polymerase sigma factor [Terriglobales bacterium]|jgi:RNA polymerase sigma factor for flagellar operon FliA|nr:FliA/WhiG family RNA polymerase sigma factor [Terriglobales bacterium]
MTPAETAYRENLEEIEDRDEFIVKELPQVYYIARRIYERLPQSVCFEDLVHAGVIGLIEAVRSYQPGKSVPFNAFAKFRIRGAILDSLRALDWGSRPLRRKGRRIEEAIAKLSAQFGRQPEEDEIAAEMGVSIEKLHEIAQRLDGLNLVSQQVNSAFDRAEKHDLIESAPSRDESPYELRVRSETRERLAEAIATLSEKEQLVISLYYREELTMKEIAKIVNLAESRVSQIHALVLPKLRAALEKSLCGERQG